MTNLSSKGNKKRIITPENSLLFLPVIVGVLILTALLAFVFRPLTKKLSNEESQIQVLKDKILYIPVYKKYINDLTISTNKAQKQQERLVQITSDPEQLNTILSEINRISTDNQIEIITVKPNQIKKYTESNNKASDNSTNNNLLLDDPFLLPSIEKHQFQITLKGEFNSLLSFLKEIELLQAIAITDNIEIKSNEINTNKDKLNLTMSFNLTTYAKIKSKTFESKP